MTNESKFNFTFNPDQSWWSKYVLGGYETLLDQGCLDTASSPLVEELRRVELSEDEKKRLQRVGGKILRQKNNKGIGYLSSSSEHDRVQELKAASYIAWCFQEKGNPARPVIVSIDSFYRFIPGNLSLVSKTQIFDDITQAYKDQFAIILTGFSDSEIFTHRILNRIPIQDAAGLNTFRTTPFGRELLVFATRQLPSLMEKEEGDLNAVLHKLTEAGSSPEEDANLLLVTGLLLQDRQVWQNLWYEGRKKGTPLYIVAPMSFHDAMNRLNLMWGHGAIDYNYRASHSLGNGNAPPLEDKVELQNYYVQGLPSEEFQRRVKPILNEFK